MQKSKRSKQAGDRLYQTIPAKDGTLATAAMALSSLKSITVQPKAIFDIVNIMFGFDEWGKDRRLEDDHVYVLELSTCMTRSVWFVEYL